MHDFRDILKEAQQILEIINEDPSSYDYCTTGTGDSTADFWEFTIPLAQENLYLIAWCEDFHLTGWEIKYLDD